MTDRLVTVTAYSSDTDANVAKGALDGAGIESVVDDAVERRVKVRVENVEAIRAGDVLTEHCPSLAEIDEPDEEEPTPVCPACDSRDISPSRRAHTFALVVAVAIALGVAAGLAEAALFAAAAAGVFLLIGGRWRCGACGETWD